MVQSVELLLGEAADAAVRDQWATLAAHGLPSQADHTSSSNAPHITVGVADHIDVAAELRLTNVLGNLPLTLRVGPLTLLGGHRIVLARMVVVSPPLLSLHRAVSQALAGCPGQPENLQPGRWVPHVTLARHMPPDLLAHAIRVLAQSSASPGPLEGHALFVRRWDSEARRTWIIGA